MKLSSKDKSSNDKYSTKFETNKYLIYELHKRSNELNGTLDFSIQRLTKNNLQQLLMAMDKLATGNLYLDHDENYRFHYTKK